MVRSCFSKASFWSITSAQTSAKRIERSVSATDRFAPSRPCTLRLASHARRCRQGGSSCPATASRSEMASRVMPASGPTSMRSSPSSAFTSVDLPAFGRPMMARLDRAVLAIFLTSSSISALLRAASSRRSPRRVRSCPRRAPQRARRARRSRAKRLQANRIPPRLPSCLLAAITTGLPERRNSSAKRSSSGVTPVRASTRNRATCQRPRWRPRSARTHARFKRLSSVRSSKARRVDQVQVEIAQTARAPLCGRG